MEMEEKGSWREVGGVIVPDAEGFVDAIADTGGMEVRRPVSPVWLANAEP